MSSFREQFFNKRKEKFHEIFTKILNKIFCSTLLYWVQGTSFNNGMKVRPIIVKSEDSKHKLYILSEYVAQCTVFTEET
jgi:hypothetical protein